MAVTKGTKRKVNQKSGPGGSLDFLEKILLKLYLIGQQLHSFTGLALHIHSDKTFLSAEQLSQTVETCLKIWIIYTWLSNGYFCS